VVFDIQLRSFLSNGSYFLLAVPPQLVADIRQIPALLPNNLTANETAKAIYIEMQNRLEKMRSMLVSRTTPSEDQTPSDPAMNCTFAVYGQQRPVKASQDRVTEYENELRNPTGVSALHLAQPEIDAYVYSPNCEMLLKISNVKGLEMDRFWQKAVNYAFFLGLVAALQALLLVRQMQKTSTPSVSVFRIPVLHPLYSWIRQ